MDLLGRSTLEFHQHSSGAEATAELISPILTKLAASTLTLMGSHVSALFENLKEKKLRILEGPFDGSESPIWAKGYSRRVKSGFDEVSSKFR